MFAGFVLGVLTVVGIEVLGLLFLIRRLSRKVEEQQTKIAQSLSSSAEDELDQSYPNKQGFVWVLVKEMVVTDKGSRLQKRKKEILEVSPVRKYAKLRDQSLILSETDGSYIEIQLEGWKVEAVSATSFSSRKWAKRYPIKVESKSSATYQGNKSFYVYLETSWEKESWCKALLLASCEDKDKIKWFTKLRSDYHSYLTSLNIEYPSLLKPSIGFNPITIDKSIKVDASSSKVRHFLKKLAKKASKSGLEYKGNWTPISGLEDRKINENSYSVQESISAGGLAKMVQTGKAPDNDVEDNKVPSSFSAFSGSGSRSQFPVSSDTESVDKSRSDEGTLCWNLLISRLFFDAKSNAQIRSSMQARIQRTLSNMRIPSYIGEVCCTGVDPGNLPPYVHGMRVLPSDMNEVVALEVDIEYCGGFVLDIETRLEVRELDSPKSLDNDLDAMAEVTSDLAEGFEHFGKHLKLSEGIINQREQNSEGHPKPDEMKSCTSDSQGSSNVSKWKSILNSVAKQVSQVPLSLGIRLVSLRGTLRLHIKPPPSDQLWFAFTSMPGIDFNLESAVGDHKISSGHIALFLISRFKAAIRETMVLPNCESICIPWMLAEKDDWVAQKAAPFIWINQEAFSDLTTLQELPRFPPGDETRLHEACRGTTNTLTEDKPDEAKKFECVQKLMNEPLDESACSINPVNQLELKRQPSQELENSLLGNGVQPQEPHQWDKEENTEGQSPNPEQQTRSRSLVLTEEQTETMGGDDAGTKRLGRKARMLGLGKKMGEKLEEKRRNIEERGRHIVEKLRS